MNYTMEGSRTKVLWGVLLCLAAGRSREANALPVAHLKNVRPVVEVRSGGMPFRMVRARQAVSFGNILRTGPRGKADILFSNGTQLAMRENSQIEILPPAAPGNPLVVRVFGALSEVFVRRHGNTEIHTAAAIAAARGTEFLVRLPTEDSTEVTVREGVVDFFNPQGAVVINVGEQSMARVGQRPTPPRAVDVTGLLQWTADITGLPINLELQTPGLQGTQSTLAVQNALALAGGNRLEEARAALQPLAQGAGRDAALPLTALGLLALQNGEVDGALTQLQEAVARDPQLPQARALLALAFLNANRASEAEQSAREAVRLNARSSLAQSTLGYVLFFRGNPREAERAARRAGALDPLSPFALLTQGRVLLSQLKTDESREAFAQAAALVPNLPLAHIELAQADLRLDHLPQAESEFRRALELQPASSAANVGLAVAAQRQGRLEEARGLYQKVLAADEKNTSARANYAQLLLEEGKLNEARAELERVTGDDPDSGIAFVRMSEVALYQQNLHAAQEFARRAVQLLPRSAPAHYQLGRVYFEQERLVQAENQFRQGATLDPQSAQSRYALGLTRERTERGLLASGTSLQSSAAIGGQGSALSLQNLQTPGAEDRIQGLSADPTLVRNATRAYGDTEVSGVIGTQHSRDYGASHLRLSDDRRGIVGLNGERQSSDGERVQDDSHLDRAGLLLGRKANNNASNVYLLADYERERQGINTTTIDTGPASSGRNAYKLPRIIGGANWQRGENARTRFMVQASEADLRLFNTTNTFNSFIKFPSLNAEVRHDQQVGDHHVLTFGAGAGIRRQRVETEATVPFPIRARAAIEARQQNVYMRDEWQATPRLRVTPEMQLVKLDVSFSSAILTAPIPPFSSQRATTLGVPNLVVAYQTGARGDVRLRARRLAGGINDFRLLVPTDPFSLSRADLPGANALDPLSTGRSVELEYDHTFANASFVRLGILQQDLRGGDVANTRAGPFAQARVRAAQIDYEGTLNRDTTFFVRADLTSAKDELLNQYIPFVPRSTYGVGVQYLNARGLFAQSTLVYQGSSYFDSFDPTTPDFRRVGGFSVVNLRAGKRSGLHSIVWVEVLNAGDKNYAVLDQIQTGRQLRLGATRRF